MRAYPVCTAQHDDALEIGAAQVGPIQVRVLQEGTHTGVITHLAELGCGVRR